MPAGLQHQENFRQRQFLSRTWGGKGSSRGGESLTSGKRHFDGGPWASMRLGLWRSVYPLGSAIGLQHCSWFSAHLPHGCSSLNLRPGSYFFLVQPLPGVGVRLLTEQTAPKLMAEAKQLCPGAPHGEDSHPGPLRLRLYWVCHWAGPRSPLFSLCSPPALCSPGVPEVSH